MRKKILILLLIFICLFSVNVSAYNDSVADILHIEKEHDKINLYYFYGEECPSCKKLTQTLDELTNEFPNELNVYSYEVWHNTDNHDLLESAATQFGYTKENGVPIILVNDTMMCGYSEQYKNKLETIINEFKNDIPPDESSKKNTDYILPIIGDVDAKDVSIPLVSIVLGFIDGFNPCAMWILLFLISLLLGMSNKKRAWILGFTFLFSSASVYFLSMLGLNIVLDIFYYDWLKNIVSVFIILAGFINFKKYHENKKEQIGCNIVDDKKRKTIISKSQKIVNRNNIISAVIGISILAITVNSLELFCSLGFPAVFTEILSINNIYGSVRILYILLYVFFYMIDDIIVFIISMVTIKVTGITNKYNRLCTLISSIIMVVIGLLLIFKPAWLMLNFE